MSGGKQPVTATGCGYQIYIDDRDYDGFACRRINQSLPDDQLPDVTGLSCPEIIKKQDAVIKAYQQQIGNMERDYNQARRRGQLVFDNPLGLYTPPPIDPTVPLDRQPVSLGIPPSQLACKGRGTINDCGQFIQDSNGPIILFENTVKPLNRRTTI